MLAAEPEPHRPTPFGDRVRPHLGVSGEARNIESPAGMGSVREAKGKVGDPVVIHLNRSDTDDGVAIGVNEGFLGEVLVAESNPGGLASMDDAGIHEPIGAVTVSLCAKEDA